VIDAGMIPKVDSAVAALEAGVEKVQFVPDMKAVVLFKVNVTALERTDHVKH
jgi:acetylglutamate kinase